MVLKLVNGFIIAEGEYSELAAYTALLFECMNLTDESRQKIKAKKEADLYSKLMNMTFDELMKNENEEEDGHD